MNSIEINDVSVRFRLYHERVFTLKEKVINIIKRKNSYEDFYAVNNITVNLKKGETLGIIGENGSGKSTLLKLICRVLKPTTGSVLVNGKISALLELGAGFDQELTGRENIFLNGSLMGFSKREMQKKFKHILEFSELENFIDLPVKNYSSGMYMRLGFAIATDVDPDILIIDEILAVGDSSFQKKCVNKIKDFRKQGKTIIIVTHSDSMIREFCDRALWIKDGRKQMLDSADLTVYEYMKFLQKKEKRKLEEAYERGEIGSVTTSEEEPKTVPDIVPEAVIEEASEPKVAIEEPREATTEEPVPAVEEVPFHQPQRWGSHEIVIDSLEFFSSDHVKKNVFDVGEDFYVKIKYTPHGKIDNPAFGLEIFRPDIRSVHATNTFLRKVKTGIVDTPGEMLLKYSNVPLGEGEYVVSACIAKKDDHGVTAPYDFHKLMYTFSVYNQLDSEQGQIGEIYLKHDWELKKG